MYVNLLQVDINTKNFDIPSKYTVCDIVIGGGGFRSYYHLGLFKIIKNLISNNKIKPRHIIGTSSGAISAVYHTCGLSDDLILQTYVLIKEQMGLGASLHDSAIHVLKQILPLDSHIICSGRVRIFVSVLGWGGFYPWYIDHFDTRDDLINAISASINIPWFTSNSWGGTMLKGSRCYDGAFVSIVPSLDIHDIPQLEISTHCVLYPKRHTLFPGDSHIYLLGLRGLVETYDFFANQSKPNGIIRWIDSYTDDKSKQKTKSKLFGFIIPGLMFVYGLKFNK